MVALLGSCSLVDVFAEWHGFGVPQSRVWFGVSLGGRGISRLVDRVRQVPLVRLCVVVPGVECLRLWLLLESISEKFSRSRIVVPPVV